MRAIFRFIGSLLLAAVLALPGFGQGTTTAGINGRVMDDQGTPLPGATVVAVHQPSGSQYGGITDTEGYYRIPNMQVGGPYKVTVSFVGYQPSEKDGVYLTLGQTYHLDVVLSQQNIQLAEVQVAGSRLGQYNVIDGNRTGAETVIGKQEIATMPTVARDLTDFTRLTPQATVGGDGSISIAGMNNRYNAISIDGAVNNDVFGLAATGTNGGQTGGTPISMDAIEQFQVVLAPYDVRQSGFAGASINAVTRSGTNTFTGSAYYLTRNQNLAGLTPTDNETIDRTKLPDFTSKTYGFRLGGPIIKNKLFFFASAELERDETPKPFDFANYTGDSDLATVNAVADHLRNTYGYEPGDFLNKTATLTSDKFLLKLDWNINQHQKLMVRHSYTKNVALQANASSRTALGFLNNSVYFPSVTNSSALELKSNYDNSSNSLVVGYTAVFDDRDPYGANFPSLTIYDGAGTIYAGSEPYSTANQLKQNVLTLTDNFTLYKGKHTITIGTNNEFSHTYNLFIRKNFGEYRYSSVADFLTTGTAGEVPAYQYERGYSLVDNITGDGSAAAADFNMIQLGAYAQDEFQVTNDFKLTYGLRLDMPIFPTTPKVDNHFNTVTAPNLEAAGWDLMGAQAGHLPKPQVLFSPRVGFNWDVNGDKTLQVRGGVGIFTSRLPLVWPGGSYTNNGVTIGGVYHRSSWTVDVNGTPTLFPIYFNSQWDNQYTNADFGYSDAPWGGQIDLFAKDFKFPQVLRASLAADYKLPWNMVGTIEGMFSKTINNILYYNVNVSPDPEFYLTGADNRPYWNSTSLDPDYTRVILGTNTHKGYAYDITLQIQKPFDNGLTASVAYTYGHSMAVNDATSSQNSSQWRYMEQVNGLNNLDLSYSDFDLGSRVVAFLSYRKEYINHLATMIGLYYNGQSGQRYSYIYSDYGAMDGNNESDNNLIYIPKDQGEIVFADPATAAQQWTDLNDFIENDPYLSKHRGEYAERNGARLPFSNVVDMKIAQDIFVTTGDMKHTLQVTFDVFNLTNMLNKNWGRRYYLTNDYYRLIRYEGFDTDGTTPTFSFTKPSGDIWSIDDSGIVSSRWQAQIGLRYIF